MNSMDSLRYSDADPSRGSGWNEGPERTLSSVNKPSTIATAGTHEPARGSGPAAVNALYRPAFLLVVLLGAALRLAWLGRKSFWLDEIMSISIARLDGVGFRNIVLSWEANMSLYYVLLRAWTRAGAESEFGIRLLSAVPAIVAVVVFYQVAARLFDAPTGLVAALLLAVNAFAIRYAQEARSYSQYLLLTLLACGLFLKAIDSGQRREWAWLVVSLLLGIYSHFFAALLLPVLWAGAAFHRQRRRVWKPLLATSLVTIAGALPLAMYVLLKDKGQLDWVPRTSARQIYELLQLLSGHAGLLLLVAAGALCVAGAALRVHYANHEGSWPYVFAWSWLLLPIALTGLVSLAKPVFVPRFLLLCLPPFLLLVAVGLRRLRPRWLFALALVAVVALSLRGTAEYYRTGFDPPEQDWRGLISDVIARSRGGDAIVFYHPLARLPYEYYRQRFPARAPVEVAFPQRSDARLLKGSPLDASFLSSLPARHPRVWLVQNYGPDAFSQQLREFLGAHYQMQEERVYGTIHVLLYAK
jgi:mannosyltransferase